MKNYQQSLIITTTPSAIYTALTSIAGLRAWWTQDCDGGTDIGSTLHFRFGECYKDMRIQQLEPNSTVSWLCTRAHIVAESVKRPDEWKGTEIVFRLTDEGQGKTRLDFEHIGLVPSFECYALCQHRWQHFLSSLQQYLETGAGMPFVLVTHSIA